MCCTVFYSIYYILRFASEAMLNSAMSISTLRSIKRMNMTKALRWGGGESGEFPRKLPSFPVRFPNSPKIKIR